MPIFYRPKKIPEALQEKDVSQQLAKAVARNVHLNKEDAEGSEWIIRRAVIQTVMEKEGEDEIDHSRLLLLLLAGCLMIAVMVTIFYMKMKRNQSHSKVGYRAFCIKF